VDNTKFNKVSSRDLCVANMVAEIEGRATSWRRMTMTLMTMGLNGLIIDRDGEQNEKISVYYALTLRQQQREA
jgi:hypothetical protein